MKKFMNSPNTLVANWLDGFSAAHSDIVVMSPSRTFLRRRDHSRSKVVLISGGGSGHEPLDAGFVGHGMLDAACPGQIFTSPTPIKSSKPHMNWPAKPAPFSSSRTTPAIE